MDISRRDFLKGAAAGIAGVSLTRIPGIAGVTAEAADAAPEAAAEVPSSPAVTRLIGDVLNPQDESYTSYTTDYSHIFSPLKIGGITLKNRIVKSAAGSETSINADWPSDSYLNFYRQFAKGGVGMICTENSTAIPPAISFDLPAMDGDMPAMGGDLPPMGGDMPAMGADMPPMGGDMPAIGGDLPPMGGDMPAMGGDLPPMGGDMPAMGADMPPIGGDLPAMGADLPDMGGVLPAMGGNPPPATSHRPLSFTSDDGIPAQKVISDAMHELDTPVLAQLYDMMPSGCSSSNIHIYELEPNMVTARMQTTEEVQNEIREFIDAAERYYKAGFDGIELNASCNHYFSTFLSRAVNTERTDQYSGASIENRCRILTEIISGIRERVGNDFVVQVLFSAVEGNLAELGMDSSCTTIEEAIEFAKLFEKAGASSLHIRSETYGHHCAGFMPDVLHLTEHGHTGYGSVMEYGRHMDPVLGKYDGVGALIEAAARIKANVSIPVGAVGSMDPRMAPDLLDKAIADGKLDFLLMTRPLMADPNMPNKLKEGRRDEVAPCTHCLTCFAAPIDMGMPMYCRVNPSLTRAYNEDMPEGYEPLPAEVKKNVMVIGGGAAGMEAARIAAQRGHSVTLYEKEAELGGRLDGLQKLKGPHEKILDHKNYLIRQLELNGVKVVTGSEVTADTVKKAAPDTVVVAVGSLPAELEDLTPVKGKIVEMADILQDLKEDKGLPAGQNVVVIGGQFQACVLAVSLRMAGKTVTILNPGPESEYYRNGPTWPREMNVRWLAARGVKTYHNIKLDSITDTEVKFKAENSTELTVPCDAVINALPEKTNRSLVDEISAFCPEVYAVGNCYSPNTIANATGRANVIARRIGGPAPAPAEMPAMPMAGGQVYTSTISGMGDVTVSITVENGKIVQALVDTSNETQGIGRGLGEDFARQIMESGSIDAVSGASVTSDAVQKAFADCLKQAGLA